VLLHRLFGYSKRLIVSHAWIRYTTPIVPMMSGSSLLRVTIMDYKVRALIHCRFKPNLRTLLLDPSQEQLREYGGNHV